jgi:ATP-dependent Clp protease ATP-binding subunit ClpA
MADWYLSKQARHALRSARTLAGERHHTALGPPHLLAAILRQWDDEHAGGPALLRACGLTAEQAAEHTATLLHAYDTPQAPATPTEPRPNPALRFTLAQAFRIATQARAPYVGTEHLVMAMLWEDYGGGLRRQGVSHAQAAEQLATLPHTEQATDEEAIEPLRRWRRQRPRRPAWPSWPVSRPNTTPSTDASARCITCSRCGERAQPARS